MPFEPAPPALWSKGFTRAVSFLAFLSSTAVLSQGLGGSPVAADSMNFAVATVQIKIPGGEGCFLAWLCTSRPPCLVNVVVSPHSGRRGKTVMWTVFDNQAPQEMKGKERLGTEKRSQKRTKKAAPS